MLKNKIANINILVIILFILVILSLFFHLSFFYRLGIYFSFFGLLAYGSFRISSGFYIDAFCKKTTEEKVIALTFDDGPNNNLTSEILEILAKHKIKAAFFVIGKKLYAHEKQLRRINDEGHLIGSHSYSHQKSFGFLSVKKICEELEATEKIIYELINKRIKFFRPPFGVTNPNIAGAVKLMDYRTIGWSLRSFDTTAKDSSKLLNRLTSKLKSGDIILFHDNVKLTVKILDDFILFAKENGFEFKRVDDLIGENGYA